MQQRRSQKFYQKNEKQVMDVLGFKPTKRSGAGWIEKEDGENKYCLCQLKSTDRSSIAVSKLDVDKLLYHSSVSKKLPVFAIQFLQSNETFLVVRPEDIGGIAKYVQTQAPPKLVEPIISQNNNIEQQQVIKAKTIRSGGSAREQFIEQNKSKFKKGIKSAK